MRVCFMRLTARRSGDRFGMRSLKWFTRDLLKTAGRRYACLPPPYFSSFSRTHILTFSSIHSHSLSSNISYAHVQWASDEYVNPAVEKTKGWGVKELRKLCVYLRSLHFNDVSEVHGLILTSTFTHTFIHTQTHTLNNHTYSHNICLFIAMAFSSVVPGPVATSGQLG